MNALEVIETEVLVVGAGPVGLSTALTLARSGVRVLLVERRATFSQHPKAVAAHARTMEIFYQLGVADEVRIAGGWQRSDPLRIGWTTRLGGYDLGELVVGEDADEVAKYDSWSPEISCLACQDQFEPVLGEALTEYANVDVRMSSEVIDVRQDDRSVTATIRRADGTHYDVRALYLVAADGVRSPVRMREGIKEYASPAFGTSINIRFNAPLEPYRKGRNRLLFWTVNKDAQGAFVWRRKGDEWMFNFEVPHGREANEYDEERCKEVVRAAAGVPADLPVEIIGIFVWRYDQAYAEQWRAGRIFLAGDAAHRFPPHGGFGMNSGVQDCFNLAWKLRAVLQWGAGEGLLDTYEAERKPVAIMNGEQCLLNTHRMQETGSLMSDVRVLDAIEDEVAGAPIRNAIIEALPKQRELIFSHGQQFGYVYESGAVIADGTDAPDFVVSDYAPTGFPGARAPLTWLLDGRGASYSLLDLFDGGFMLLAGPDAKAWAEAAAAVSQASGVPLKCVCVGAKGFLEAPSAAPWLQIAGITSGGALLVRPDGHVAMRHARVPDKPERVLAEALDRILCRT